MHGRALSLSRVNFAIWPRCLRFHSLRLESLRSRGSGARSRICIRLNFLLKAVHTKILLHIQEVFIQLLHPILHSLVHVSKTVTLIPLLLLPLLLLLLLMLLLWLLNLKLAMRIRQLETFVLIWSFRAIAIDTLDCFAFTVHANLLLTLLGCFLVNLAIRSCCSGVRGR